MAGLLAVWRVVVQGRHDTAEYRVISLRLWRNLWHTSLPCRSAGLAAADGHLGAVCGGPLPGPGEAWPGSSTKGLATPDGERLMHDPPWFPQVRRLTSNGHLSAQQSHASKGGVRTHRCESDGEDSLRQLLVVDLGVVDLLAVDLGAADLTDRMPERRQSS